MYSGEWSRVESTRYVLYYYDLCLDECGNYVQRKYSVYIKRAHNIMLSKTCIYIYLRVKHKNNK